ncbi:hypothetical protein M3Y96_00548500 [Aphelenchoides besseyi]|nr:hypothetical protein M3Y96_00548500 [Aphelenchoides besseyi]
MSNFSRDVERAVRSVVIISFMSSSALFLVMLHLIFNKSRQLHKYRWYLFNTGEFLTQEDRSFRSHLGLCVSLACVHQPRRHSLSFSVYNVQFVLVDRTELRSFRVLRRLLCYHKPESQHRLVATVSFLAGVSPGWLSDFFDRSKTIYFVYAFVHLFIYATVLLPMLIGQKWDWRETRLQFLTENPDLLDRIDRPMICFTNNKNLRSFQLYILIIVVFVVIFGKILHGILIHLLRKTKRRSTITSTYKFQLMLLNSINCQIVIAYVFFVFPVLIQGVLVYNNNPHVGKWATVMSALIGFHGTVDDLAIIWFIKPWRIEVLYRIRRLFNPTYENSITAATVASPSLLTVLPPNHLTAQHSLPFVDQRRRIY